MTPPPCLGTPRHKLGGYREYAPPPFLGHFAEAIWTHRAPDELPPGDGAMHRVLPDPALSLAFCCRRGRDGVPLEPRVIVIGPKSRPQVFAFRERHEIAAVRMKLEWSAHLLDLVPADHRDAEHDLARVLPRVAAELLEPLCRSHSRSEAAGLLAAAVVRGAVRIRGRGPEASGHALDLVRRTGGCVTVERVAGRVGIPLRTLRRRVRLEAGISLKEYARVTRLLRAVTTADQGLSPAWASIAAETGFCDQSHLIRECRALTGFAPGEVYRERRAQAETSNPR